MSPRRGYPALSLLADPVRHLAWLPARLAGAYKEQLCLRIQRDAGMMTWTYTDLVRRVGEAASTLAHRGTRAGERVVIYGENSPEWLVAFFAIQLLGCVAVPLDPTLPEGDLLAILQRLQIRHGFAHPRHMLLLQRCLGSDTAAIALITPETAEVVSEPPAPPLEHGAAPALVVHTPGATGQPRAVLHTHQGLLFGIHRTCEVLYTHPGDHFYAQLPLSQPFGLTSVLTAMLNGVPVTMPASNRLESLPVALRAAEATWLPAEQAILSELARAVRARLDPLGRLTLGLAGLARAFFGADAARKLCADQLKSLGGLRVILAAGSPLSPGAAQLFHALGVTVLHGYMQAETASPVTLTSGPWVPGRGAGKPLRKVQLTIHEPDATGVGEIWVQSEQLMRGYLDAPGETDAAMVEGWYRTGDRGRLDPQGQLHVLGRIKTAIQLAGGTWVHPEELELVYGASPLIAQLVVIRGRDGEGQEYPFAVIHASRPGLDARGSLDRSPTALRGLLEAELVRLGARLPIEARVRGFDVVAEPLPLTAAYQVRRHAVQGMYRSEHGTMVRDAEASELAEPEAVPAGAT